jgi:transcriptional regulator with GAF, ATPase, and Fis domain
VSKFNLRDISDRLTGSRDTEAVVFEFLGYLQSLRPHWRASLAFYEVSRDALVNLYLRQGNRLERRDLTVAVDGLPPRLVRKFFHPSAFFNHASRRSLLSHLFHASPYYEPDPLEAPALGALCPLANWQSCVCLPLADREDMLAMLILASERKHAFGSKAIGEILPIKSMAALALAQHLYRAARPNHAQADERTIRAAAMEFQDRIRRLNAETAELTEANQAKARKLETLAQEIELLDKSSSQYKQELERVKSQLYALEEQAAAATQHLTEAYSQLTAAQSQLEGLQRTVGFMKEVFQVLSQEHDQEQFSRTLVTWFCEHFGVERCSLMLLDRAEESLRIAAQRGIDPELAAKVKVRVGQGIAGWVAHNRKPLFVRVRDDAGDVQHTDQDAYNSDSFICVPLIHNNRLHGVLNLSNKRNGEPFDDLDLDRALLAGSLLALTLGGQELVRRAAAWA